MPAKRKPRLNPPQRSSLEAVLSANIPTKLKLSLMGRAKLLDRPISQLVRYALEYHEATDWKAVPLGVLPAHHQTRLKDWLASADNPEVSEI